VSGRAGGIGRQSRLARRVGLIVGSGCERRAPVCARPLVTADLHQVLGADLGPLEPIPVLPQGRRLAMTRWTTWDGWMDGWSRMDEWMRQIDGQTSENFSTHNVVTKNNNIVRLQ
jgi:hypothetical protein